jgi:riboflavin synthase
LKHAVEHHVHEEEGEIFQEAKKALSDKRARELAEEMEELKMRKKGEMPEPSGLAERLRGIF